MVKDDDFQGRRLEEREDKAAEEFARKVSDLKSLTLVLGASELRENERTAFSDMQSGLLEKGRTRPLSDGQRQWLYRTLSRIGLPVPSSVVRPVPEGLRVLPLKPPEPRRL